MDSATLIISALKLLLVFTPFIIMPFLVLLERRGAAAIQDRPGPNRAAITLPGGLRIRGFGMIYNLTDGIKVFFKQSLVPPFVNKWFFIMAPTIPVMTAVLTPALIPWFGPVTYQAGDIVRTTTGSWLDANSGLLALFALGSLSVYGVVLGSWASNSKYSLLGGMRASAMMISYEVSMGLSILGLFLLIGSFSLTDAVNWQSHHAWGVVVQPIGFFLFLVAMFAETNRNPFDVAEGESELVAGFHTEYGGAKFALFMLGEYCHIVIASALIAVLFFGGYDLLPFDLSFAGRVDWLPRGPYDQAFILGHLGPVLGILLAVVGLLFLGFQWLLAKRSRLYASFAASDKKTRVREYSVFRAIFGLGGLALLVGAVASWMFLAPKPVQSNPEVYALLPTIIAALIQFGVVLAKTLFFCWLFVWVRWTLPRFRYDQIMSLGWKWLLNIGLINLLLTAVIAKLVRS